MLKENRAEQLISFIKENYCEEDESSFWAGINILQKHTQLKKVGNDSLNLLIDMLSIIKEGETRAMLIETIVKIPCFNFNNNEKLLKEYIRLVIEGNTGNEEAAKCFSYFILLGADKDKIFYQVAQNVKYKENAIKILMNIDTGLDYWNIKFNESEEFYEEVQKVKKIRYRSGVIVSFLLIVHPQVLKYSNIAPLFTHHADERLVLDWELSNSNSLQVLVKRRLISQKEADILKRLGKLINEHNKPDIIDTRKLYDEFFENKNPFDIMFNLPE